MMAENVEDIYELSPLQQGILFHTLLAPESGVYFEQFSLTLDVALDGSVLQRAWQKVVDRHPVLRTSFHWEDLDKPVQVVHRQVKLPVQCCDWRYLSPAEQTEQLKAYLKTDRARSFELSRAPLLRLTLIRLGHAVYQFIISFHHVLLDGWSMVLIFKEAFAFYEADCRLQDLRLEACRPYGDYIAWLQKQDLKEAEGFWRRILAGYAGPPSLWVDRSTEALSQPKEDYDWDQIRLSAETTRALQALARQHHLTLNTVTQGAWALLLSRYTGEEDIVFGATVSGRPAALKGVESMVGLFINTLPVRVQVSPAASLLPWLKTLQAQQFEARQYEYTPLVKVQAWSEVPQGAPLFETILGFENYPMSGPSAEQEGSKTLSRLEIFERTNYPLSVVVVPGPPLWVRIMYVRPRFDAPTITRMLGHFQMLLEGIVARPERRLSDLPLLTAAEQHQLLVEWNQTAVEYPRDACIHELFEEQVGRTPEILALVFAEEQLTYRELNRKSNQLAHYLQSQGVGPEVRVGICLERSLEMVVGLLGILKAGGAYVPLDPGYPPERLAFAVEDAQVKVLLTQGHQLEDLIKTGVQVINLKARMEEIAQQSEENPQHQATAENLAYVMYTSGSTGRPKGVSIPHRGVVRLVINTNYVNVTADDVFLQLAPISFDASTFEIWGSLLNGARLVVFSPHIPSLEELGNALQKHQVTILWLTSTLFHQMVEGHLESLRPVRQLLAGGEVLSVADVRKALEGLPGCRLINGYGPTENTTFTCTYSTVDPGQIGMTVPIGRPIANTRVYVLDRNLNAVPIGVSGELYIGGDGLAREYLNRPDLTAEKFIQNPFNQESGERLYQTGDLVRYRPDGNLEFLGRRDHQIKIRGFRVELGEIEVVLKQHPAVGDAVVLAREETPGDKRLVAYVVPRSELEPQQTSGPDLVPRLRSFLQDKLPGYMVPTAFVLLEKLPLTPSGKLDRKALRAPDAVRSQLEDQFVAPRNPVESVLARIWTEVLGFERVGAHDNFFELGGHSLLATQLISRVREAFQVEVPLRRLFEAPTLAGLATAILEEPGQRIKVEKTAQLLLTLDELSEEEVQMRLSETKLRQHERAL